MILQDLVTPALNKENHPRLQKKGVTKVRKLNLLIISMVKRDIPLMYAGARMAINMISLRMQATVISVKSKDIKHKNVGLGLLEHQDLRVTPTTARNMDIELLSANQSLCGHLINLQGETTMHTTTIGIIIPDIAITTIRSMYTFLKTT